LFLFNNTIRANSKTIRGVHYVVFSNYGGSQSIHDRIGQMIENSFETVNAVEILNPSLLGNDIAFHDE
jgi:uncharacterized protein (DUF488 family)